MNAAEKEKAKRNAGRRAAEFVRDGMVLGLGTGSTTYHFMVRLAERIGSEGLSVAGVPTSIQTAIRARELFIPLATLDDHPRLDLAVDGADQADRDFHLIKGRGPPSPARRWSRRQRPALSSSPTWRSVSSGSPGPSPWR